MIAYLRGLSVSRNNTPGGILAVGMGVTEASGIIRNIGNIDIACQNSPGSTTLSGSEEAIAVVLPRSRREFFGRTLALQEPKKKVHSYPSFINKTNKSRR